MLCFSLIKIWGDKKHPNHRPKPTKPMLNMRVKENTLLCITIIKMTLSKLPQDLATLPFILRQGRFQWPFLLCWSVYQWSHFALWSALSSLPRRFWAYLGAVQRRVLPRWWRWRCWWQWQWWWLLLILWWLYNVDPEVLCVWKFVSLNLACELLSLLVFGCFLAAACLSAWLFVYYFFIGLLDL